jgi:hypothetical protein
MGKRAVSHENDPNMIVLQPYLANHRLVGSSSLSIEHTSANEAQYRSSNKQYLLLLGLPGQSSLLDGAIQLVDGTQRKVKQQPSKHRNI